MYNSNNLIPTQAFVIKGQEFMEKALGNNTFIWSVDNNSYPCVASIVDYKRELETGGFSTDQLLTLTVRQFDSQGNPVFVGALPTAQQMIKFGGKSFRIQVVAQDYIGVGARLVITAVCPNRGA